jgi:hypothetical protein
VYAVRGSNLAVYSAPCGADRRTFPWYLTSAMGVLGIGGLFNAIGADRGAPREGSASFDGAERRRGGGDRRRDRGDRRGRRQ